MPTITDTAAATTQTVTAAIDRSVEHNEIVTVRASVAGRREAICAELARECDDSVDAGEVCEYWGANDNGEWRVHVRA